MVPNPIQIDNLGGFPPILGNTHIHLISRGYLLDIFSLYNQLMVSCWFGAFSGLGFESGYTQESQSLSFSGIQKESKPPTKPTNNHYIIDINDGSAFHITWVLPKTLVN